MHLVGAFFIVHRSENRVEGNERDIFAELQMIKSVNVYGCVAYLYLNLLFLYER